MNNYWLIRSKPHNKERINEFLEQNIVAIGWPDLKDLKGLDKESIKKILLDEYDEFKFSSAREVSLDLNLINNFVNEIQIGDIILTPTNDFVYIFKIISDYFYNKEAKIDGYSHQRNVELLKRVPRDSLNENLKKPLRTRYALANLNPYSEFINDILQSNSGSSSYNITNKDLIPVQYPLREDLNINISIPKDITKQEAERLGNFVKTLYYNEEE